MSSSRETHRSRSGLVASPYQRAPTDEWQHQQQQRASYNRKRSFSGPESIGGTGGAPALSSTSSTTGTSASNRSNSRRSKAARRNSRHGKKSCPADDLTSPLSTGNSVGGGSEVDGGGGGGGGSVGGALHRVASHLSLMMSDSKHGESFASVGGNRTDEDEQYRGRSGGGGKNLDDGEENLHHATITQISAVWRMRLTIFTILFIAATVFGRWRREKYEERQIGGGVDGTASGSFDSAMTTTTTTTPTTTDRTKVGGFDELNDGRQSCGEFFEPDPIMKLKPNTTVENMENGVVASDNYICSKMGISILRDKGGNAVDAAVATTFCLGVVNPASSGIGGGAFVLIHSDASSHAERVGRNAEGGGAGDAVNFLDARASVVDSAAHRTFKSGEGVSPGTESDAGVAMEGMAADPSSSSSLSSLSSPPSNETGLLGKRGKKVTEVIDCRETAPGKSTFDMFENLSPRATTDGGLAIAVPGELRGLELAHSRHGRLPWSEVIRPAMELARDGFRVSQHLAYDILHNKDIVLKFENLAKLLTKNNDGITLLEEGDIMIRTEYAETLRLIMRDGADAMYKGEMAETIAKDIQDAGGILTARDLEEYKPVIRDPIVARDVGGFTLVGVPPPSSGGAAIIGAARFLSGYADPFASFADALSKHRFVEACKHVFAVRMSMSDPAFDEGNATAKAVEDLVSGQYMEGLRRRTLDNDVLPLSQYGGEKWALIKDNDGEAGGEPKDAHEGDRRMRRRRAAESTGYGAEEEPTRNRRNLRLFNYLEDHGTTHLSVVDKDRNVVAITSTVNTYFGSKVLSPSTGIIFNDEMDDFASPGGPNYFGLEPTKANYITPGKRPLSSMAPTMIFRRDNDEQTPDDDMGEFFMALGSSGGPKIISAVLQVFLNYAVLGMPLFESVANPRVHDQLLYHGSSVTTFDHARLLQGPLIEVTLRTRQALAKRNHVLLPIDYLGTTQVVAADLETGRLAGVSDIRKEGCSAGY